MTRITLDAVSYADSYYDARTAIEAMTDDLDMVEIHVTRANGAPLGIVTVTLRVDFDSGNDERGDRWEVRVGDADHRPILDAAADVFTPNRAARFVLFAADVLRGLA